MIEVRQQNKMERLELLSHTALLKQGIDRTNGNTCENHRSEKFEKGILVDNKNTLVMGVPMSSRPKDFLSKENITTSTNAIAGTPRSTTEDSRNDSVASSVLLCPGAATVVGGNLPSPVSTDLEEDDDAEAITATSSIASKKITNNPHDAKSRTNESRSPVTTVEYGQFITTAPASPFPPSPRSYGYGFITNHNNMLHQTQSNDQQEYAPPHYNNCNGSIIRTLSEASFVPLYGSNLMTQNSQNTTVVLSNRREINAAFDPPQAEPQPSRLELQHRRSSPSREEMAQQVRELREQLSEKDMVVSSLQHRVSYLENQIHELRQLPTGKISHIPIK